MLPAENDANAGADVGLSKNSIYFFEWQRLGEGDDAHYCLCKWDMLLRVASVVKRMPGNGWDWNSGRWFLPTLKY